MSQEIFILVKCDDPMVLSQKYQACTAAEEKIKKIKGITKTFYTGKKEADITAFAKWDEKDIEQHVMEIKNILGVKLVETKTLVPV